MLGWSSSLWVVCLIVTKDRLRIAAGVAVRFRAMRRCLRKADELSKWQTVTMLWCLSTTHGVDHTTEEAANTNVL